MRILPFGTRVVHDNDFWMFASVQLRYSFSLKQLRFPPFLIIPLGLQTQAS
jgi:hypothetical protein